MDSRERVELACLVGGLMLLGCAGYAWLVHPLVFLDQACAEPLLPAILLGVIALVAFWARGPHRPPES